MDRKLSKFKSFTIERLKSLDSNSSSLAVIKTKCVLPYKNNILSHKYLLTTKFQTEYFRSIKNLLSSLKVFCIIQEQQLREGDDDDDEGVEKLSEIIKALEWE